MKKILKVASYLCVGLISISGGCAIGMLLTSFQNSNHQVTQATLVSPHTLVRKLDSIEFYIQKKYKYKKPNAHGTLYTNLR